MQQSEFNGILMRGGTSRGLFVHERDLPADPARRDAMLLAALGSPDPYGRQIDGLGGAISSTSKIVIVSPPVRSDSDVAYTFGQVSITRPSIDYSGNCGNLTSAVGPFAIDEGMVAVSGAEATLRLHNLNTDKIIVATIQLCDGKAAVEGDCAIDGVPGTGARIALAYQEPGGAGTGALLPTGQPADDIDIEDGTIRASIIDASNPVVYIRADAVGLTGTELPQALNADPALLARLEMIRASAARCVEQHGRNAGALGIAIVAEPTAYQTTSQTELAARDMDIVARAVSDGRVHHAYTGTGSVCMSVAARVPGSIVNDIVRSEPTGFRTVRIGHAAGILEIGSDMAERDGQPHALSVTTFRTARRLMRGTVYIPGSV